MDPFSEEWRECLKAQYLYSLETHDSNLEFSRHMLKEAGLSADEIELLTLRVTAHE